MDKILGFLDSLESLVMDAKKIPMTNKVILPEEQLLNLVSKMRDLVKTKGAIIQTEVVTQVPEKTEPLAVLDERKKDEPKPLPDDQVKHEEINSVKAQIEKIKEGGHIYADDVLSNLQLVITKMQNDILRMKGTIENGRKVIESKKQEITTH